jgi:hypothetical protein
MVLDIKDAVMCKFPAAVLREFGSYPVGLSIFLSDIDVSIDHIGEKEYLAAKSVSLRNGIFYESKGGDLVNEAEREKAVVVLSVLHEHMKVRSGLIFIRSMFIVAYFKIIYFLFAELFLGRKESVASSCSSPNY